MAKSKPAKKEDGVWCVLMKESVTRPQGQRRFGQSLAEASHVFVAQLRCTHYRLMERSRHFSVLQITQQPAIGSFLNCFATLVGQKGNIIKGG